MRARTKPLLLLGTLSLLALLGWGRSLRAQDDRWTRHHDQRVAAFTAENAKLDPARRYVVLIGDSHTEAWGQGRRAERFLPSLAPRLLNRGISADRVGEPRGVRGRLEASALRCQPSHLVLMIGVNQLGADGSGLAGAVRDLDALVAELREKLPQVPLLLLTVPPTRGGAKAFNEPIRRFNARAAEIAQARGAHLLDLHARLEDEQGELREACAARDGLHLSDEGYRAWGALLEEAFAKRGR